MNMDRFLKAEKLKNDIDNISYMIERMKHQGLDTQLSFDGNNGIVFLNYIKAPIVVEGEIKQSLISTLEKLLVELKLKFEEV